MSEGEGTSKPVIGLDDDSGALRVESKLVPKKEKAPKGIKKPKRSKKPRDGEVFPSLPSGSGHMRAGMVRVPSQRGTGLVRTPSQRAVSKDRKRQAVSGILTRVDSKRNVDTFKQEQRKPRSGFIAQFLNRAGSSRPQQTFSLTDGGFTKKAGASGAAGAAEGNLYPFDAADACDGLDDGYEADMARDAVQGTGGVFSSLLPSPLMSKPKSWSEDRSIKQQRQYNLGVLALLLALASVLVFGLLVRNKFESNAASVAGLRRADYVFYVTSDVPFTSAEGSLLTNHLIELDDDGGFLVHLGNIQATEVTDCSGNYYSELARLFETHSTLPVFMIPGQDDWPDCPDPMAAWQNWQENFYLFHENFVNHLGLVIKNEAKRKENFAIIEAEILFVGVHVVEDPTDTTGAETKERNQDNLEWIKLMSVFYIDEVRGMVLFGSALPVFDDSPNGQFFQELSDYLAGLDVPIMYLHANNQNRDPVGSLTENNSTTSNWEEETLSNNSTVHSQTLMDPSKNGPPPASLEAQIYYPFPSVGTERIRAVQVPKGGVVAPLRIRVVDNDEDPFVLEV